MFQRGNDDNRPIAGRTKRWTRVRWVVPASVGIAGVALLAACGSTSTTGQSAAAAGPSTSAAATTVVAVRTVPGAGKVLVDRAGHTLYTANQESGGMVKCTGECTSIWIPATTTSAAIHLPSGVTGHITTIKRADTGTMQLAWGGKPLYTFKLDTAAGQAKGSGAHDNFGGTAFSWKTATVAGSGGAAPAPSPTSSKGAGGYSY